MPHFNALAMSAANIAINDISLKNRFYGLHFRCKKYWCIFNHFYVIRRESYRIRWNYASSPQATQWWHINNTEYPYWTREPNFSKIRRSHAELFLGRRKFVTLELGEPNYTKFGDVRGPSQTLPTFVLDPFQNRESKAKCCNFEHPL